MMSTTEDYTEAMLLDGEIDDQSTRRSCEFDTTRGHQQNDTQVRKETVQEFTKKLQLAHKFISNIAIECEKVLSAHMRTSDPVRTQVGEVVQQQVRLADEGVRALMEQMISEIQVEAETRSENEQEILELLRIANLADTVALEALLEQSMQEKEWKQKMCEVLECESRVLLEETQQMKQKLKDQEVMIECL